MRQAPQSWSSQEDFLPKTGNFIQHKPSNFRLIHSFIEGFPDKMYKRIWYSTFNYNGYPLEHWLLILRKFLFSKLNICRNIIVITSTLFCKMLWHFYNLTSQKVYNKERTYAIRLSNSFEDFSHSSKKNFLLVGSHFPDYFKQVKILEIKCHRQLQ